MNDNMLRAQATAVFSAKLASTIDALNADILTIKQSYNGRGLPHSSMTVHDIYRRIDDSIYQLGAVAQESVIQAYEAGAHKVSRKLEAQLLDAFESCFAKGFANERSSRRN